MSIHEYSGLFLLKPSWLRVLVVQFYKVGYKLAGSANKRPFAPEALNVCDCVGSDNGVNSTSYLYPFEIFEPLRSRGSKNVTIQKLRILNSS